MRRKDGLVKSFLSVVVGLLLGLLAIRQQWPLVRVIGMVIACGVAAGVVYALFTMIRLGWVRRFARVAGRLRAGESAAVIAEFSTRRAAGDHSPEVLLALSTAYCYQGRGQEAEALVHDLRAVLEQHRVFEKKDRSSQLWGDMVNIALFDAWTAQGRFADAAHSLRPHLSKAFQPNFMTAIIAWGFFLAGDDDNTRGVLSQMQSMTTRQNPQRMVNPMFQFMVFYLRHRLLAEDHRSDLIRLRAQLAQWEDSAARNTANPYGARLREILDDVRAALKTN